MRVKVKVKVKIKVKMKICKIKILKARIKTLLFSFQPIYLFKSELLSQGFNIFIFKLIKLLIFIFSLPN